MLRGCAIGAHAVSGKSETMPAAARNLRWPSGQLVTLLADVAALNTRQVKQRTVRMPRRRCMVVVGGSATNRTSLVASPCMSQNCVFNLRRRYVCSTSHA